MKFNLSTLFLPLTANGKYSTVSPMVNEIHDIAVIGAGSWGTALAKVLSDKGHSTWLWGHNAAHMQAISWI